MAPPYYPATHSDQIEGREGYGSKVFEFAKKLSEEKIWASFDIGALLHWNLR